jgi:hypothetical protein
MFSNGQAFTIVRDSAWFFDPVTGATTELAAGLAHSRQAVFNTPQFINNHGQVVGIAANNSGGGDFVWLYDHRTKGLINSFDIRNSFTVSPLSGAEIYIQALTESGLVLGQSTRRQTNGADAGRTMWLFDSVTRTTYDLTFSQHANGSAFTEVVRLGDDGTMFGEYDSYSGNTFNGRRYFYWSIQHGFHDLESLIVGDLAAAGWADIVHNTNFSTTPLQWVNDNLLVARGQRLDGNHLQFALIRIPEPGTMSTVASTALLALVWRCGRRPSSHERKLRFH